ncbi:MAG: HD domain-containing protein [Phycisphaeraceae bacterium]|nr:HD domain-containing protein [Phycisphaeraceae bacterium]
MPNSVHLADAEANERISGLFMIQNCQLGKTRADKPYLRCLLRDRSAQVAGRMWSVSESLFEQLPTDGFVHVEGQTQLYQGKMQVIIERIEPAHPSEDELVELLPSTDHDIDAMWADLKARMDSLEHDGLRRLANQYLSDDALMSRFRQAPAAMSLHHAYLGGLLEHTLQLLTIGDHVCGLYPDLNRDLVMVGLFLHDLGKCVELTWREGFGYSRDGQLVGHIARGALWLDEKAAELAEAGSPLPEPLLEVLTHIILSHHGRPEYGALKRPATPEAIAVSQIDDLDAKLNMAMAAADRGNLGPEDSDFTEKVWSLETRIYRPDPTRLENE